MASLSLEDYADRTPELVPEEFFTGELSARGVVKNFSRLTETCKNLEILCGNSG
ncbi:MAG: DUF3833 family protein [Pseudomonadota bacterium]|nr:DUF3833 family protein [Pseudomonadota bacterium]